MSTELPGRPADAQLMGYSALIEHFRLACPAPQRLTAIASVGHRTSQVQDGVEWLLLPRNGGIRVPAQPMDHLGTALKHEGVDLRVLHCLFSQDVEREVAAFVAKNRSGVYARRAWFLYEWLTGRRLDIAEPYAVQYVPLLDPTRYIGRKPDRSTRHKIDNNLPGTPGYCPLIRRTERLSADRIAGLGEEARIIVAAADPAVLRRAVSYMLLNESRGSFEIEGETPPHSRLERWGRLIAEARDIDLSIPALERLHRSLFDKTQMFSAYGLRTSGGFIGSHDARNQTPIPDHVSARPADLTALLAGLLESYKLLRASSYNPVLTAAMLAFGFVFIHPFADGNGRLHRLLIQKALADMDFNPPGVVLPVSAAILQDLVGYRSALEDYSLPTLSGIEWTATPDGNVRVENDTRFLYSYFDATRQAEYLTDCIERTVRFSLPAEFQFLHSFDQAKARIAVVADLPDRLSSLFINFCVQNGGRLSNRKRQDYFAQIPDEVITDLEAAVADSFVLQS